MNADRIISELMKRLEGRRTISEAKEVLGEPEAVFEWRWSEDRPDGTVDEFVRQHKFSFAGGTAVLSERADGSFAWFFSE